MLKTVKQHNDKVAREKILTENIRRCSGVKCPNCGSEMRLTGECAQRGYECYELAKCTEVGCDGFADLRV